MTRRLRSALEIVSDIGKLGFDLQHHSDAEIAQAVGLLRAVNPVLFAWLWQVLGSPPSTNAVDPADVKGQKDATRA